jgi:hypothetical protein
MLGKTPGAAIDGRDGVQRGKRFSIPISWNDAALLADTA